MTRHGTVFNLSRSIRDEDHISDIASWIFAPMRATTGTPRTQTRGELFAQRPPGLDEQRAKVGELVIERDFLSKAFGR